MKKSIPTGVVEYAELQTNNYYVVDKTLMIKEFLMRKSKVTLITRPRRFGKTLNMSMMSEFFDITKKSQTIFKDTNIAKTEYCKEMNQYPVIYLSFANCKGEYELMVEQLFQILVHVFNSYQKEFKDKKISEGLYLQIMKSYRALQEGKELVSIPMSLKILCEVLSVVYGKKVIVLIDEYDTPFIGAYAQGYYQKIKGVLSSFLHSTLKDNQYLKYAMLTGIQRVAKENIFSDLNNLKVFTVKNKEYAQYFGFTTEETNAILAYYDLELTEDVKLMYDGYNMGGVEIYNPWSIINYVDERKLMSFWINTSSNTMIRTFMKQSDKSFKVEYETLIKQGYLDAQVMMDTSFYEDDSTSNLWGLFVNAGYLTIEKEVPYDRYRIKVPNNEVRKEFQSLTMNYLNISDSTFLNMFVSLVEKNKGKVLDAYRKLILELPSYHDLKDENSYHMMMLGMCACLYEHYIVFSNREVGKGRCDIILKAKKKELPSFVLEFKYTKDINQLETIAKQAIEQIITQKYDQELSGEIIYIGLAHCGKDVEMCWQEKK